MKRYQQYELSNVHRTSTSAKPLIGTSATTSCSSFSLSAEHPHLTIPHNVGIFNIASVYCWYLQHPPRVASFRSSEHGDGLGDIINAVVSVVQSVTSRLETSRYRDFSQFFESIGLSLENYGLEKKSRYRSR